MPDEIMSEIWKIKDDNASEFSNDVKAYVQYLRSKNKTEAHEITNLKDFQNRSKQVHPSNLQ